VRQYLNAERRNKTTRSGMRALRASGQLPGVIYGNKMEAIAVSVPTLEIQRQLRVATSELIDLNVEGAGKVPVIFAEIQRDPATGDLLHIDFQQVAMNEVIRMKVPIEYVGTAAGTKVGGILQTQETMLEIEGLPAAIPTSIQVDVSELELGDKLFAEQIAVPAELTLITPSEQLLASISVPRGAKETEEESEIA
jgi:large subunit ribosomal protein L25